MFFPSITESGSFVRISKMASLLKVLKWQYFPVFVCFNLSYLLANFPLWCLLFLTFGLSQLIYAYYNSLSIMARGRGVVITGCDTGFGHLLAEKLHSLEFTVFACCLDTKSYGALGLQSLGNDTGRLHVIQMDVQNQADVDEARRYVETHLPVQGLWGLVNNAGRYSVGFLEWLSIEDYETVASVNLYGAIRVTKAFLPLIRKSQGRIVNVSSILGRVADPFMGAYCITKFGLEAFTDVLRLEMKAFNVKVSLIEPGNFLAATNVTSGKDGLIVMARQKWEQLDVNIQKDYGKEILDRYIRLGEIMMNLSERDTSVVIDSMAESVYRVHPKNRYLEASPSDKIMAYIIQFLPSFITDPIRLSLSSQLINLYR